MKQTEFIDFGSVKNLSAIFSRLHTKKVFLITGKKSFENIKNSIFQNLENIEFYRFSDFSANVKIEDLKNALHIFRQDSYDLILAVGGGSVMDMAKLIKAFADKSLHEIQNYLLNPKNLEIKTIPLIAIPTTSGTGSEATSFAVLYQNKIKYSIEHPQLLPNFAIVDPELTSDLPPQITAETGADAFCQAIESYWSVNSTSESSAYAKEAIKLIFNNLEKAVNSPDENSRYNMAKAANLAGKAINISKTTAPHALSYAFTSYYNINHGQACALTLAQFLDFNFYVDEASVQDPRGCGHVQKTILEICDLLNCQDVKQAKKVIENFFKKISLDFSLSKITNFDINLIVENINFERLKNNPRKVSKEDAIRIITQIYEKN